MSGYKLVDKTPFEYIGRKITTLVRSTVEVVGICRLVNKKISNTQLVLECSICSKDKELFPEPFIKSVYEFENGFTGCGCSNRVTYNEAQQYIRMKRVFKEDLPFEFVGLGKFEGVKTLVRFKCLANPKHKKIREVSIYTINRLGLYCGACVKEKVDKLKSESFKEREYLKRMKQEKTK